MTAALERGEWKAARPGRTLPPGKTRYPLYRSLGWPPGPVWTGGKSRPNRHSIPERPARSSVAIPTELPGPHQSGVLNVFISVSTDITKGMRDFEVKSDKLQVTYVQEARWYCVQADGRSRARFSMVSSEFFINIILPAAIWPWSRLSL